MDIKQEPLILQLASLVVYGDLEKLCLCLQIFNHSPGTCNVVVIDSCYSILECGIKGFERT